VFGVTATGLENNTVCHPDGVSLVNVADANNVPDALHKLPICVPVFVAALWNRIPVTDPAADAVNFTPRSTELGSPESTIPGVPEKSKIVSSGMTAADALDAGDVPVLSTAATVNV
jgi:hypothetical protein